MRWNILLGPLLGVVGNECGWKGPDSWLLFLTQKNDSTGQKDGRLVRGQMSIKRGCLA